MSVYFITCREQGICKIGRSQNAKSRRSSLQTASPSRLVLEAELAGASELERELHKRFADSRLTGEWFTITDELDAVIREAASLRLPPVEEVERRKHQSDEELMEASLAEDRRMLADAMVAFDRLAPAICPNLPATIERFYRPVAAVGGQFSNHYAIRETHSHRTLCADMGLTFDQADRLCDVLEGVRQRSLDLELTRQRSAAA